MWRTPHGLEIVRVSGQTELLTAEAGWHFSFMLHFIVTFSHVSVVPHLQSREEVYKIPGLLPQLTQHSFSFKSPFILSRWNHGFEYRPHAVGP